jgi:Fe2+ or Zn2+ uptake regulation protein
MAVAARHEGVAAGDAVDDSTLASAGFKPVSHIVEVEGECGACQERGGAE